MYNVELADQRGLDEANRAELEKCYELLDNCLAQPWKNCESPTEVVERVHDLECTLQAIWGFQVSSDFHNYWFRIKGCTCPKLDNEELMGSRMRYYNMNCPYHGSSKAKDWSFIDL